jgi:SnoaL-like domain
VGVPRPSAGVCELIRKMFAAADAQDGEAMFRLHAAEPTLTFVGVGPGELWQGPDEVAAALRAAHDGQAGARFQIDRWFGYEDEEFGWGIGEGSLVLAEDIRFPFRLTVVARHAGGRWASRFSQISIAASDAAFAARLAPGRALTATEPRRE